MRANLVLDRSIRLNLVLWDSVLFLGRFLTRLNVVLGKFLVQLSVVSGRFLLRQNLVLGIFSYATGSCFRQVCYAN